MSPKNKILSMLFFWIFACFSEFKKITSPFFNFTIGPSILSQGVMVVAFPGLSVFNCVPVAM